MRSNPRTNGYRFRHNLTPTMTPIDQFKPLGRETRHHPKRQIDKLAACLDEFGFVGPVVVDAKGRVVAGRALVEAAKQLDLRWFKTLAADAEHFRCVVAALHIS